MKIRITVEIPDDEIENFLTAAARLGFIREDPRKRWTAPEIKEALRAVLLSRVRGLEKA